MPASETINPRMSGEELRGSWPGRALEFARHMPQLRTALLSVLADNFDETMPFLLHAVTGISSITAPYYVSSPKIDKRGCIVADLIGTDGWKYKNAVIFLNQWQMESTFRRLADKLKLADADRIDLFIAVRHWVKADQRLDPTMDRRDPDAKRLVVH